MIPVPRPVNRPLMACAYCRFGFIRFTALATALVTAGDAERARQLLERAVLDLGRLFEPASELSVQARIALRDLLIEQGEYARAGAIQSQIAETGSEVDARSGQAAILINGGVKCPSA